MDPRYFEKPYYLVAGKSGDKAYALLREAMKRTESVGIGKILIRQKQHLAERTAPRSSTGMFTSPKVMFPAR